MHRADVCALQLRQTLQAEDATGALPCMERTLAVWARWNAWLGRVAGAHVQHAQFLKRIPVLNISLPALPIAIGSKKTCPDRLVITSRFDCVIAV